MKQSFILPTVILLIGFHKINGEATWSFGKDEEGSVLAEHKTGYIHLFQRITKVPVLEASPCAKVVLISVQVDNKLSTPEVSYNEDTRNVEIVYKSLQFSVSKYDIKVKAKLRPNCGKDENKIYIDRDDSKDDDSKDDDRKDDDSKDNDSKDDDSKDDDDCEDDDSDDDSDNDDCYDDDCEDNCECDGSEDNCECDDSEDDCECDDSEDDCECDDSEDDCEDDDSEDDDHNIHFCECE